MKDLLIVLPAYNEEACIGEFLDKIKADPIYAEADIAVINDGSRDKTAQIAKSRGVTVISHIFNLGYGCALQTAYKYADEKGYKFLIQIDSDGQHDVCNLQNIYGILTRKDNPPDVVIGSRFMDGSVTFKISALKKIVISFFRLLIKASTGNKILDPTSGLQGMSRRIFVHNAVFLNFFSDYPDANMIVQSLLNNFKLEETSAVMHPRMTGKSMHSGLKPIIYTVTMIISTFVVIARKKVFRKS